MAQYSTGTVSVTNGSAVVTGTGTSWGAGVGMTAGDLFSIPDSNTAYEIASIDSTTQITLSSVYAGTTASGISYVVHSSFTPYYDVPYPDKGDVETSTIFKRAMLKLEEKLREDGYNFLTVLDRNLTAPPGSPSEGDLYLVAATATGDWAGQEGNIAHYLSATWVFITPSEGWVLWVADEDIGLTHVNGSWAASVSTAAVTAAGAAMLTGAAFSGTVTMPTLGVSSSGNVIPTVATSTANAVGFDFYQSGVTHWQHGVGVGDGSANYNIYESKAASTGVRMSVASGGNVTLNGNVGVGISPSGKFQVNGATNQNLLVTGQVSHTGAVALNAVNDTNTANVPIEFRASEFFFDVGNVTATGNTTVGGEIIGNNGGSLILNSTTGPTYLRSQTGSSIRIGDNTNASVQLAGGGGATTIGGNATVNGLHTVSQSGATSGTLVLGNTSSSASFGFTVAGSGDGFGAGGFYIRNLTAGHNPLTISTTGAALFSSTVQSTSSLIVNTAALATTATDGFLYLPTCAGTPTGTPTAYTGRVPMIYDSVNNKQYVYNGGWKGSGAYA